MPIDDDLFEDNEVENIQIDISNSEDGKDNEDAIFTDSPELRKFIEVLREQLADVDKFSFILYTKTFYTLLDHINYRFKYLFSNESTQMIAPNKSMTRDFIAEAGVVDTRNNCAHIARNFGLSDSIKYIECERSIVAATYYKEVLSHALAQIDNDMNLDNDNSYLKYCYEHLQKELNLTISYHNILLEIYDTYTDKYGIQLDVNILDHGIFSYLTVWERELYGPHIQAFELEDLGEITDAVELRDEYVSRTAKHISAFIIAIQDILNRVQNGDASDFDNSFHRAYN